jgi:hypothetical protein
MRLEMGTFPVTDVRFGSETRWADGVLEIDHDALLGDVLADPRLLSASIELARPGESVRIWPVRDVLEPRVKIEGSGRPYPGINGREVAAVGSGRTHRLAGVGVAEVCELLWHDGGGDYQDVFIDMSGPWADLVPQAQLINVCVVAEPDRTLDINEQNLAVHGATLLVSDTLAKAVRELEPPETTTYELGPTTEKLPVVYYVQFLHSPFAKSQDLHTFHTGVYGLSNLTPPWLLHPNEVLDGAISGPYRTAFAMSWTVLNNPVLLELYRRHNVDFDFRGVIAFKTEWTTQHEKNLMADQACKLLQMLGAEGVLMTWDADGNEYMEVVYTLQHCERAGIKTVLMTSEDLPEGGDPSLLIPAPEAAGLVSTGFKRNIDIETPMLPAVKRVIGNATRNRWRDARGVAVLDRTEQMGLEREPPWRFDDHYGFNRISTDAY